MARLKEVGIYFKDYRPYQALKEFYENKGFNGNFEDIFSDFMDECWDGFIKGYLRDFEREEYEDILGSY